MDFLYTWVVGKRLSPTTHTFQKEADMNDNILHPGGSDAVVPDSSSDILVTDSPVDIPETSDPESSTEAMTETTSAEQEQTQGQDAEENAFQDSPGETSPVTNTPEPAQPTTTPEPTSLPEQVAQELDPQKDADANKEEDIKQSADADADTAQALGDIKILLTEMKEEQEDYHNAVLEYQTQVADEQKYFTEQSKNVLSILVVIALILGFASGILLARIVWRKI